MTFLKLGHRYVHAEMITDVFVQEQRPKEPDRHAEIYFAAPMGQRVVSDAPLEVTTRHLHVSGDDADRLIRFLEDHSVDRA